MRRDNSRTQNRLDVAAQPPMRRRERRLSLAACLLLVAACGTTVPQAAQPVTDGLSSLEATAEQQGADQAAGDVAGGPAGELHDAPDAASSLNPSTSGDRGSVVEDDGLGGAAAPPGTQPVALGAAAPGLSRDAVTLGIEVPQDTGTASAVFGRSLSTGDGRKQAQAIANYINTHGGFGGRRAQLLFYAYDVLSERSSADEQAECDHFTQDNKSFGVVMFQSPSSSTLLSCLSKARVSMMSTSGSITLAEERAARRMWFSSGDLLYERFAERYVNALFAEKFFSNGAGIGLLYQDDVSNEPAVAAVREALRVKGLRLDEAYGLSKPEDLQNAVLRFRSAGVTHVLNLAYGANIVLFMNTAESQTYRPTYGLSTHDGPGAFVELLAPPAQLTGSSAIGWAPTADVNANQDPGPVSPLQTLCLRLAAEAGEDVSNRLVVTSTLRYCDALFLLRSGLSATTDPTEVGFARAIESLSYRFESSYTFRTSFSSARHDAVASYRPLRYLADCRCFKYSGPLRPL